MLVNAAKSMTYSSLSLRGSFQAASCGGVNRSSCALLGHKKPRRSGVSIQAGYIQYCTNLLTFGTTSKLPSASPMLKLAGFAWVEILQMP